jgi:hypothetical protein
MIEVDHVNRAPPSDTLVTLLSLAALTGPLCFLIITINTINTIRAGEDTLPFIIV